jgi:hypothetical protein
VSTQPFNLENPYGMHCQAEWGARAGNPVHPLWLRVAAFAYARHRRNGHANFEPGELSWILGKPGDGKWDDVPTPRVSEAIKLAKQYAWIAEESNAKCLVVPGHAVQGGLGHAGEKCSVHVRPRHRQRSA